MIVVDASAATDLVLDREPATWVEQALAEAGYASAPELLDLEVLSALRRVEATGKVSAQRVEAAVSLLSELRIVRFSHQPLASRAWQLRMHLTPYDAAYVALAEALDAELVTTDKRLARTHGHRARITVYPA